MRSQDRYVKATARIERDTARTDVTESGSELGDLLGEDELRRALTILLAGPDFRGRPEWEVIGRNVLALAHRDSRQWRCYASEYQDAYIFGAIEFLRLHPDTVINARNPWGLVVARGRFAGEWAVGAEVTCGLTDRDRVSHRVRFTDTPGVVSLDRYRRARELENREPGRTQ